MQIPNSMTNEYDRRALQHLVAAVHAPDSLLRRTSGRIGDGLGKVARAAVQRLPDQVTETGEAALRSALKGLQVLTLDPALNSVSTDRVLREYRSAGHELSTFDEIKLLDLRTLDAVTPRLAVRYAAGTAVEGAGAGLIITGGEALAAFGSVASAGAAAAPSAGAVVGAMAFDAAAVLAASARVVGRTAAFYGYDVHEPHEQVMALSIINWSNSGTQTAKLAAFQQLSRVTQQLVRGAAWAQLSEHVFVRVIEELYLRLGVRLTQRKLGQAVPVLGIALGAGMNATLLHSIGSSAADAYRLRHLSEKYGFDLADLVADESPVGQPSDMDIERLVIETAATESEPDAQ